MEKEKFKVLLYLKKSAEDKSGAIPIMGRITISNSKNGNSMAQFSTKLSCREKLWNARASRLNGKSKIAVETNAKIEKLLLTINESYEKLLQINRPFGAADVKNLVQGIATTQMTLVKLAERVRDERLARIGIDLSKSSTTHYVSGVRHLGEFINKKFKCEDLTFKQLNEQFIRDFCDFILLDKGFSQRTLCHYVILVKNITRIAFREGYADRHHFAYYHPSKPKKKAPRALSSERFEAIRDLKINPDDKALNQARDMFIFSCYAGSSYADTVALTKDNIITDDNGSMWLKYNRQKNNQLSRVKVLPEAVAIIEKYLDKDRDSIFPYMAYSKVQANIKTIRTALMINDNLSYHQSRHTFASLITLDQGVPIETVSKMLGHSNISTTQIYARVTPRKLFEDMDIYIEKTKHLKLVL